MTNLDSIFKSRDITLPTKVCLVKVMVFPVVMYGCESCAQRFPASSVLAREGAGCGSVGDVPGAWLAGLHSRLPRGVRPRLEGKPRTPLSSRVATRLSWSPLSGLKAHEV